MHKQTTANTAKGESTRERILNAARAQLIDHGIERFALRELADGLQIKLGNLQYYFNTKEALVLQVLEAEAAKDRAIIAQHQHAETAASTTLKAIVRDLTSRWSGQSGVLFSTLGTLAIHNNTYKRLYRQIYAEFYAALEAPLRTLNPNLSAAELALRARLITALIDGAPMQPQIPNRRLFLQRIQAEAESIATG